LLFSSQKVIEGRMPQVLFGSFYHYETIACPVLRVFVKSGNKFYCFLRASLAARRACGTRNDALLSLTQPFSLRSVWDKSQTYQVVIARKRASGRAGQTCRLRRFILVEMTVLVPR
jgi:hypothetical protein